MKILIISPTREEIRPLDRMLEELEAAGTLRNHLIDLAVTGVGSTLTAFRLTKLLSPANWDLVLQLGICGSFDVTLQNGTVVNVIEERFADLGAEDGENFLDAFELGLLEPDTFPFMNGSLLNKSTVKSDTLDSLPRVAGITVNKVHGNEKNITSVTSKYHPRVESMEGAALFYCCLMESVPFLELRCVSNTVEKRDRSKWNIPLAVEKLNQTAMKIISELLEIKNP